MYLKTLKLVGFKSFADRTRLEYRPGISVVVGPNGSGKSNLVDAVHWVLGTQAPRSLRTSKMEDVIFAGTVTRPALNRAEVTVVLDNTGRDLDLDLDEVAITRRLFRDGSSEYEINGIECRLLDVTELLSDSGVGRHQHIIVNQGQVDSVLAADASEHRAIIEEAAGILKHKLRKERAMRRLERTGEDCQRLTDILSEVARQMRPLKRQAEAAHRQEEAAAEVRALTLFLGGEELRRLDDVISRSAAEKEALDRAIHAAQTEIAALAPEAADLARRSQTLSASTETDGLAAARLETTLESLRRIAQVAHERHRSGLSRREDVDERRRDLEAELADIDTELSGLISAEEAARQQVGQCEATLRLIEAHERSLADQMGLSAEGALAVSQGEHRSMVASDERDRHELDEVRKRLMVLTEQIGAENEAAERHLNETRALDSEVGFASRSYEDAAARSRQEQTTWEQAQLDQQEARFAAAAARARREAISRTGDIESQRLVAQAQGARGLITDLLSVPAEWLAATEAALGSWSHAVAFESGADLEDAVRQLKAHGGGGVSVVGDWKGAGYDASAVAHQIGLEALIDLIGLSGESALGRALLGDVAVAEGWATAWAAVQRHPGLRVVTPEGDLITIEGICTAHPENRSLLEAEADQEGAELELARATSRVNTAHRQFEGSRNAERAALETLEALEIKLAGATEMLGRSRRHSAELAAEVGRLHSRESLLETTIGERQAALKQLVASMEALEGDEGRRQALLAELDDRRRQLAKEQEQTRELWKQAAMASSMAAERRSMLDARQQSVNAELSGGSQPGRMVTVETLSRLARVETLARRAIDVVNGRINELRDRLAAERAENRTVNLDLSERQLRLADLEASLDTDKSALGELAIAAAESRVRREAVVESLAREADASPEEALAANRPATASEDLSELLATRAAQLRRMGPVNPLAAEEYRELSERHEFMSSQLEDLERSRTELRKVMKALDEEIESRFVAAFEEVAANYAEYFTVLFPGGQGKMRLTEPDQPLTSGVEIEAQPHGKKIAKLSLLSGGERSLAALAFLFAVFSARPSPFYILDEVEAALDDANLRRFLRLLEAFRGESQLILITHQQQTMEAADVLYGVTMEPGGSSQVISRQFVLT
ncbi:MAG TPA: chromosome segregation protein SMC [Acidimicrobiia bacterium]|nr:chromosome segregation protein SMC [Acidimicrobiia bacterium]